MDHGLIYTRNWREEGIFYQVGECTCGEPLSVTSVLGPNRVRRNLGRAHKNHIERLARGTATASNPASQGVIEGPPVGGRDLLAGW